MPSKAISKTFLRSCAAARDEESPGLSPAADAGEPLDKKVATQQRASSNGTRPERVGIEHSFHVPIRENRTPRTGSLR